MLILTVSWYFKKGVYLGPDEILLRELFKLKPSFYLVCSWEMNLTMRFYETKFTFRITEG